MGRRLQVMQDRVLSQVIPSHVKLDQCGGACVDNPVHTCLATDWKVVEISVTILLSSDFGEGDAICSKINMTSHTRCACDCAVKPELCNNKQRHDVNTCSCSCKNIADKDGCDDWDFIGCRCISSPPTVLRSIPGIISFTVLSIIIIALLVFIVVKQRKKGTGHPSENEEAGQNLVRQPRSAVEISKNES